LFVVRKRKSEKEGERENVFVVGEKEREENR
jgi:hypothetical protein